MEHSCAKERPADLLEEAEDLASKTTLAMPWIDRRTGSRVPCNIHMIAEEIDVAVDYLLMTFTPPRLRDNFSGG